MNPGDSSHEYQQAQCARNWSESKTDLSAELFSYNAKDFSDFAHRCVCAFAVVGVNRPSRNFRSALDSLQTEG